MRHVQLRQTHHFVGPLVAVQISDVGADGGDRIVSSVDLFHFGKHFTSVVQSQGQQRSQLILGQHELCRTVSNRPCFLFRAANHFNALEGLQLVDIFVKVKFSIFRFSRTHLSHVRFQHVLKHFNGQFPKHRALANVGVRHVLRISMG